MAKQKSMYFINDEFAIAQFVEHKSVSLHNYMQTNRESQFFLFHKHITHSDLISCGKRNERQGFDKNYLYYLTPEQNEKYANEKSTAHQSCISCSIEFYKTFNIPTHEQSKMICINDYADMYVVNDSLKYFTSHYTKRVISELNRVIPNWVNSEDDINLSEGNFTPIRVTRAAHGLGTEKDIEFHKLRKSIFKNDIFMLLIEKKPNRKPIIFILLEKNPIFFTIIKETSSAWENYSKKQQELVESKLKTNNLIEEDVKSRVQQSLWKTKLAEELMNYTTKEGEVFCPLTYIKGQFESLSPLFIASHIKRFEDCDSAKEAWDLNNGLLLCANADALFDKHLITINENRDLIFSFLIDNDILLKQSLSLLQPIFKIILNDERMKYLENHRSLFLQKEEKRRRG